MWKSRHNVKRTVYTVISNLCPVCRLEHDIVLSPTEVLTWLFARWTDQLPKQVLLTDGLKRSAAKNALPYDLLAAAAVAPTGRT